MKNCIFSKYRSDENFTTSSFISVLENLSIAQLNTFISLLLEEHSEDVFSFSNQLHLSTDRRESIYADAALSMSADILIETKIVPDTDAKEQVQKYIKSIAHNKDKFRNKKTICIFLSPDNDPPEWIKKVKKSEGVHVYFLSFSRISSAIDMIISGFDDKPQYNPLSDKEVFLLRQFQMHINETVISDPTDNEVLIVAAGRAYEEYESIQSGLFSAYICQENRFFRKDAKYLAFYSHGIVNPLVPTIIGKVNSITMDSDSFACLYEELKDNCIQGSKKLLNESENDIQEIFERSLKSKFFDRAQRKKMFILLSSPEDDLTHKINENGILNDKLDKNGRPTAFLQRQRYASLRKLQKAQKTSELE